jgi:hypothetical protein
MMKIQLLKVDNSAVNLAKLSEKILHKINNVDDNDTKLCTQEALRLFESLKYIPLINALVTLNQEVVRVLAIFFRAGYLLGRAIDRNSLTINVQREDDDSNCTNIESNPTHSHSDSTGHSS